MVLEKLSIYLRHTKDIGRITPNMAKVGSPSLLEMNMMVTWKMVCMLVMAYIDGLMVGVMKGSGGMV